MNGSADREQREWQYSAERRSLLVGGRDLVIL